MSSLANSTHCQPSEMEFVEKQVYIDDAKINYFKAGHGDHNVLIIPGIPGTIWVDFEPQVYGFNPEVFTIIGWDPPGYGGSRPEERDFSIRFYERDADAAAKLLKALDVEKCSVLGWCDGGVASMIMAAKYPELVNKLVIWGTRAFLIDEDMDGLRETLDLDTWSTRVLSNTLRVYDRKTLMMLLNKWMNTLDEIKEKYQGDLCKKLVDKITAPTLILHGEKDPFCPKLHFHFLLEHIKGSKYYSFPDGRHGIHFKYAESFNKIVQSFLQTGQF